MQKIGGSGEKGCTKLAHKHNSRHNTFSCRPPTSSNLPNQVCLILSIKESVIEFTQWVAFDGLLKKLGNEFMRRGSNRNTVGFRPLSLKIL